MRYLQVIHSLPNRTRLRCSTLRKEPQHVTPLADELAAVAGVHEVKVRPFTGSMLVLHDRDVATSTLTDAAQRVLACDFVLAPHERPPLDGAVPELAKIARLAAAAFRDIDRNMLRSSQGSLDLGTLATLGFFGAGAIQLALEREVEMPPWFNLAWWGYRTFMTNEQDEISSIGVDDE